MLTSLLRIENVLVDNKGRALGVLLGANSDLPDGTVLAKDIVQLLGSDLVW